MVLQRDLAINLAERSRHEQAKMVVLQQQQQQQQSRSIENLATDLHPAVSQLPADARKSSSDIKDTVRKGEKPDVTMADADIKAESQEHDGAVPHSVDTREKPSLNTSAEMLQKDDISSQSAATAKRIPENPKEAYNDPMTDLPKEHDQLDRELFEKTPTTAGMKDIDFDNLFEDGDEINPEKLEVNESTSSKANVEAASESIKSADPLPASLGVTTTNVPATAPSAPATSEPAITTATTATEAAVSSFLPGLESYANSVSLPDGASADVPLDLDFLNSSISVDDLNSINNTNNNVVNGAASSVPNDPPQLSMGTANNNNLSDVNIINNINSNSHVSNEVANGNAIPETLNEANLDDLFSFSGVGDANGDANNSNSFDLDDLGDLGDILGDGGIGVNIGGAGVNGNENRNGSENNANASTNSNAAVNGDGNGNNDDLMTSTDFDDMFGALAGT